MEEHVFRRAARTIQAADAGRPRIAERRGERDHLPHVVRELPRQLPGVDAAQAPADQADRSCVPGAERGEALAEGAYGLRARPEVPPEPPAVHVIPAVPQKPAERLRRAVTREPARQDEDRVSVATWRAGEHR